MKTRLAADRESTTCSASSTERRTNRFAVAIFTCLIVATSHALAAKVDGPPGGGELRFAVHGEPKTLDPHLIPDEPSEVIAYLTGGVLIRQNRVTQELEPALAASWKVLEKGRAIEFHLRTGVAFSDGTPFGAGDVAHTIRRISDPAFHSPIADTMRSGKGDITAEVRGASTVLVRLPAPVAGLPALFDQLAIVSSRSPRKLGATLGPFEIADYKAGSYVLLRRNAHYWKTDSKGHALPYLESVRIDIQTNRDVEVMRFRRGELHLVNGLDPESFDRVSADMPAAVRDLGPSMDTEQIWFNQVAAAPLPSYKKEWFRNTAFRRAISSAINRDDICRLVYRGHARPAAGPISSANHLWLNARLKAPVYSPDSALAQLTQIGFRREGQMLVDRSGHPVEFSVATNAGSKTRERMAALIQADLAKLGIKLNIVTMDFASLIERITRTFQYEACLLGQNLEVDPNTQLNVWRSSAPNHQWNPEQKTPETAWEADIDRLVDEQASAVDQKKRKAAFDRVQEIIVEQQPFIYLVHKNSLVGISPALANTRPAPLRPFTFWNVETLALSASTGR
jgi:peptide/nickel transport system substrate-binding protein